jgi:hypothetical protein
MASKEQKTSWVLVECVSQFRMRYMVEVPADHPEYALDTVTLNQAKEFSQEHLGETIVSHRVIKERDALELCDVDNNYCKSWTKAKKLENFFTYEQDLPKSN